MVRSIQQAIIRVAVALAFIIVAGVGADSAAAHHSYGAHYDTTQIVTTSGVIQELQYVNPHIIVMLETAGTEEAPGKLWMLDMPAPSRAQNMGLTPEALEVGTPLTVEAWPSRTNDVDLAPTLITFDDSGQTVRIR